MLRRALAPSPELPERDCLLFRMAGSRPCGSRSPDGGGRQGNLSRSEHPIAASANSLTTARLPGFRAASTANQHNRHIGGHTTQAGPPWNPTLLSRLRQALAALLPWTRGPPPYGAPPSARCAPDRNECRSAF